MGQNHQARTGGTVWEFTQGLEQLSSPKPEWRNLVRDQAQGRLCRKVSPKQWDTLALKAIVVPPH